MPDFLANIDRRTQLAGKNRLELLLFTLNKRQIFGINVFKVQEVIKCPPLIHIPHANGNVKGVATIRGRTLTILDMAAAIGEAPIDDPENCFVVVSEFNRSVQGFLVRTVERIINMNWSDIFPPPSGAGGSAYLTAVTQVEDKLVEILDVEKILCELVGQPEYEVGETMAGEGDKKIMLVDDSSVARKQAGRLLQSLGFDVVVLKNGREAYDYLLEMLTRGENPREVFFMIISDLEMPEMDGYTFTSKIRAHERLKNLYILLHTSLSGVFNEQLVKKVGADEFIAKFKPELLAEAVARQLERSQ